MKGGLSPDLKEEVRQVLEGVACLQQEWLPELVLQFHDPESVYNGHPYLFRKAFPDVSPEDYQRLSQAALLISGAVCLRDKVMDEPDAVVLRHSLFRIQAMEYEAYRIWQKLFAPERPFWRTYRTLVSDYARLNLEEARFASGKWPWSYFTVEFAAELARCNAGLACSTIAALGELSAQTQNGGPLIESVQYYNVARQFWDDVCDWKEDLLAGHPSLVIARVYQSRPELEKIDKDNELCTDFAREVYYGGHMAFVLNLALQNLSAAEGAVADLPALAWHDLLGFLREKCATLLEDVNRIVHRNLGGSVQQVVGKDDHVVGNVRG